MAIGSSIGGGCGRHCLAPKAGCDFVSAMHNMRAPGRIWVDSTRRKTTAKTDMIRPNALGSAIVCSGILERIQGSRTTASRVVGDTMHLGAGLLGHVAQSVQGWPLQRPQSPGAPALQITPPGRLSGLSRTSGSVLAGCCGWSRWQSNAGEMRHILKRGLRTGPALDDPCRCKCCACS